MEARPLTQVLAATESNSSDSDCQTVTAGCREANQPAPVNTANINKLIETLRSIPPARFTMDWWVRDIRNERTVTAGQLLNDCGTCGCIGGWTNALFGLDREKGGTESAADALGLGWSAGYSLFYPDEDVVTDYTKVTRRQAIRVLEHLRDTGVVDWSVRGRR